VPRELQESVMKLRNYFPISVGVFLMLIGAVHFLAFPVLPFAVLILFGETLLGFQVENHKVQHWVDDLWKAIRH
jgi:hypothetical protein